MKKSERKLEILSVLGLLLASLFWGISFPAMKMASSLPTVYILAVRFSAAALLLSLAFFRHFKNFNKNILKCALILSIFLFLMYFLATVGIKYTTSSRASFFTCMTFVTVPLINRIFYKVKFTKITIISVLLCFIGIFLLSYTDDLGGFGFNIGDIICILASVAAAIYIINLERVANAEWMDSILYTIFLIAFIALWSFIASLFTGDFQRGVEATTPFLLGVLLFMGVFCSAASTLLQSFCQKHVPANRTGIIFAMEPASGCIFSLIILGEVMSLYAWIGALLVMISLLYMEIATAKVEEKAEKPKAQGEVDTGINNRKAI